MQFLNHTIDSTITTGLLPSDRSAKSVKRNYMTRSHLVWNDFKFFNFQGEFSQYWILFKQELRAKGFGLPGMWPGAGGWFGLNTFPDDGKIKKDYQGRMIAWLSGMR